MLECVLNLSEDRDDATIDALAALAAPLVLDVHRDRDHNRSVFTIAGPGAQVESRIRALASCAVQRLDLNVHEGAHPRIGIVDVVPWIALSGWPLRNGPMSEAIGARDRFLSWAGRQLDLPCFRYGPERSLPALRRHAWHDLAPDTGPTAAHPRAGAAAVGARGLLVAYNLWLSEADIATAKRVAAAIRGPNLRSLGLQVGARVQVSCNLIRPLTLGPADAFDAVSSRVDVAGAELVGLVPRAALDAVPRHRWKALDLDDSTTIEARLERAGLEGGK